MQLKTILGAAVFGLLLAGCGSGGSATTSSSSTTTTPPKSGYVNVVVSDEKDSKSTPKSFSSDSPSST